jgi:hypothetical protein
MIANNLFHVDDERDRHCAVLLLFDRRLSRIRFIDDIDIEPMNDNLRTREEKKKKTSIFHVRSCFSSQ